MLLAGAITLLLVILWPAAGTSRTGLAPDEVGPTAAEHRERAGLRASTAVHRAAAEQVEPASPPAPSHRVLVVDGEDEPIEVALLELESGEHVLTDAGGLATLRAARGSGSIRIRVSKSGFVTSTRDVRVGDWTASVRLFRATTITGDVVNSESGLPVGGALVEAFHYGCHYEQSCETDALGRFELGNIPLDCAFALRTTAPGHAVSFERRELREGDREPVRVLLEPGHEVELFVHDGLSGRPIACASVFAHGFESSPGRTSAMGSTICDGIARDPQAGRTFFVHAAGYAPVSVSQNSTHAGGDAPLDVPLYEEIEVRILTGRFGSALVEYATFEVPGSCARRLYRADARFPYPEHVRWSPPPLHSWRAIEAPEDGAVRIGGLHVGLEGLRIRGSMESQPLEVRDFAEPGRTLTVSL